MTILRFFVIVIACGFTSLPSYASDDPELIDQRVRARITQLIERPDLSKLDGTSFVAEVEFIITRQNQVVVLEVYGENPFFDDYLKDQLNYRKLRIKEAQILTPYRMTIRFHKPHESDIPDYALN